MNKTLKTWVEKIEANNPKQVADLYHKDGLLLGTFSNIERRGKPLILNYFQRLLKSKIKVEIITNQEYKSDYIVASSGLYNFIVDGEIIRARFSFVFIKTKYSWEIFSHHSSVLPEEE